MKISYFNNIKQTTPDSETDILSFLNNVKLGTWERLIKPINSEKDKKKRSALKAKSLPYVTISGTFTKRANNDLNKHSGYICLDIDDIENLAQEWTKVIADPYTFGAFRSASGKGIAVLVQIDPAKHLDSYLSLESYYLESYAITLDKACKDIARARFVSNDPETFINPNAKIFKPIAKKVKKAPINKLPQIITGENDIDFIIEQINASGVDITGTYSNWINIGFALVDDLGENGRQHYHAISRFNEKYTPETCDKQYNHCLKSDGQGIKISTLFYHAKEANLNLVSPKTKHIVAAAKQAKRGGRSSDSVKKLLTNIDGITEKESEDLINKVFDSNVDLKLTEDLTNLEKLEMFIKNNYNLKRNEVNRYIENNGEEVDTVFNNSVYFQVQRIVSEKIAFDTVERLISSDFVPDYNPLKDYLEAHSHLNPSGLLDKLAASIDTDTGAKFDDVDPDYKYLFIRKWFVGIIASIYGQHSPLLLVLTGGQNTGKTEFFRRLLPAEFKPYYAESKLDAGKDDEILMTQKLLIMDDELGGKSKQEAKRLKELTSKDEFTLREPYGRKNVRLKRLAVLCGTSNDELVLNDPTGNRRIIPINVLSIDHKLYNSINKKELIIEAYNLYKDGGEWQLTAEDVIKLNKNTGEFEQIRSEAELISQFYKTPQFKNSNQQTEKLTATEMKIHIEAESGQKLSVWKIGQELKALGFIQEQRKINGINQRLYEVVNVSPEEDKKERYSKDEEKNEEYPF
jgi:predicted P-loop ATPase